MRVTFPNIQQIIDQFNSFVPKVDPRFIAAISAVSVLIFARLLYLKCFPSKQITSNLVRQPSLTRVHTLFRRRTSFVLADIKKRCDEFFSSVLSAPPELPKEKIRGTVVWIKDFFGPIYQKGYSLLNPSIADDRSQINDLCKKTDTAKKIVEICKKHSHVLLDFAIYQALYSEMIQKLKEGEKDALEKLCTYWEGKGFVIALKEELDESNRPLLRSYRDCLLFYHPYISPNDCEKQVQLLISAVEKSLFKEDPKRAIGFLSSFLPIIFREGGLSSSHPIIQELKKLASQTSVECSDLLYTSTIFPVMGKSNEGISPLELPKVKEVVYRQVGQKSSLKWLHNSDLSSLEGDPILGPVRRLFDETEQEPSQKQLLEALFSQTPKAAVQEFLDCQMQGVFDKKPILKKGLLTTLPTWNSEQPILLNSNTLFYTSHLRAEECFILSFAAFTDNEFAISKPIVILTADLKRDLGEKFEESPKLDQYLLEKASQAISEEENVIKECLKREFCNFL